MEQPEIIERVDKLEEKFGFAMHLSAMSDQNLVDRFNREIGNPGWGNASSYFLFCLENEIKSRDFESSCLFSENRMRLDKPVTLANQKLTVTA